MSIPNESNKSGFALDKKNYKLILIGLAIIIFGFILMTGGRSHDPRYLMNRCSIPVGSLLHR